MKKNILYIALLSCFMFGLQSCENDYADSTRKHVYKDGEDRPLIMKAAATVKIDIDVFAGDTDPASIDLSLYADVIQKQLGMTIDELITAIGNKKAKVCPANPNRLLWIGSEPNAGSYSWYMNNSGGLSDANSEYLFATVGFDLSSKEFKIVLDENAGGTVPLYIGFPLTDDYDTHVLFVFTVTAFDKSFVVKDVSIPAGDYNTYQLKFTDIAENIFYTFGMTPEAFNAAIDAETGGALKMYMIDHSTKLFMWDGASTANNGGYWMNASHNICTWGSAGFSYFIEPWTGGDMSFAIGRAPGIEAGAVFDIKFGVSNADRSKNMTLFVTATFE